MDFMLADALGFGDGTGEQGTKSEYEKLSDLCTALVIAEEGSLIPLEPVGNTLLSALKAEEKSGDVHVMAARALALLLDKFSFSFKLFKKKNIQSVTECLQHVFSLVTQRTSTLTFDKTTRAELIEELLRCLTHGCCSPLPVVQKMMPPVDVQLSFCESAVDGSKWASCKVPQHCALLTRRGLGDGQNEARVHDLLRHHLELLLELDMDYEWDELLRTVVEAIVMVRVWTSGAAAAATAAVGPASAATPKSTNTCSKQKDNQTGRAGSGTAAAEPTAATPRRAPIASDFIALCERVCTSHTAPARKSLVLACTAFTLTANELRGDTTLAGRAGLLKCVASLIGRDADTTLTFSNPFTTKATVTSDENEADDAFKALPNLQWSVPESSWSALLLVSKVLGVEPPVRGAYVWAWRGDGDAYYWYRRREREAMTDALFQGQRTVALKSGTHEADLVLLLDRSVRTEMVTRIHFQPIPCAVTYDGTPLTSTKTMQTNLARICGADVLANVVHMLRTLSFGHTALAVFAKAVHLYVVCCGGPSAMPDESEAALRMYAVDHDAATVEALASALLIADPNWAGTLLAAGVADALEQQLTAAPLAPAHVTRRPAMGTKAAAAGGGGGGGGSTTRKRRRSASPTPLQPSARRSPLVSLIRVGTGSAAASQGTSPVIAPLQLPPGTNTSALLQHGSTSELVDLLHNAASHDFEMTPAAAADVDAITPLSDAARRITTAVTMYTLKVLNTQTIAGRHASPLLQRLEQQRHRRPSTVTVCPPFVADASGALGAPSGAHGGWCPAGHSLQIHASTNWCCNVCGERSAFAAWSCRVCNYDVCHRCTERVLHRLDVSDTACVGDVIRYWAARSRETDTTVHDRPTTEYPEFLYTRDRRVLSAALPASSLSSSDDVVHMGPMIGACPCGVSCPDITHGALASDWTEPTAHPSALWWHLIHRYSGDVAGEPATCRAIVELIETFAADIFLTGTQGLPHIVRNLLMALRDHLPLDLKVRVAHFLTAGCRRYALQFIQDTGDVLLRGSVTGEVESNGLAFRVTVPRASSDGQEMLRVLHTAFSQSIPLRNRVEFRFTGEEGTGSGPTQELYTELFTYFVGQEDFWSRTDEGGRVPFPSCERVYIREWFVLGAACGRACIDEYQIRLELLPLAWHLIHHTSHADDSSQTRALTNLFSELQPRLAKSLQQLETDFHSDEELAALGLEDDDGAPVTLASRDAYISRTWHASIAVGLQNFNAFVMGLLTSIDLAAFSLLSPDELSHMLCGPTADHDTPLFTEDDLRTATVGAHGYTTGCKEVETFISIVGALDRTHQAYFIEFLTGSAYLPHNGLRGLKGKITVVRKDMVGTGEQTLPSCNTCFLYLKLPPYSSADIMRQRLLVAIVEGRKNFSLS